MDDPQIHVCFPFCSTDLQTPESASCSLFQMLHDTSVSEKNPENMIVSSIIAVVGIFGMFSNAAAIISVLCNPVLRSSFGVLCLSHSVANMGVLFVFVFWLAPVTLIQSGISTGVVGKLLGQANIMFWNHAASMKSYCEQRRKRRQIEARFFMQTLYHNALFFYELSSFYYVTTLFENRWAVFFTSTFAWELCHALDG
ncbi:hypothetical protein OESDEN_10664 [Oesophagostomum dentatum]|uniref:7TM GPCR serpentine receptor class x (Srx) domain-containing protein n=1 Tax=Oesophagostomum dentatum TaxID=61180 RepID=A0A0B1SX14_OESDE|nr:hypothetical protein OESDEN_10664 [Oesophagostomum dentatum]